jgi:hypothetical protein
MGAINDIHRVVDGGMHYGEAACWMDGGRLRNRRTIVRSVLFRCITGLSGAAADSALSEGQVLRVGIAHAVASDVESRDSSGRVKRNFFP